MNEPRQLRDYQIDARDAVLSCFARGERGVVVLPTGTGKSTVIAAVVDAAVAVDQRVLLLAHRRELLDQMIGAVHSVNPALVDATGFVQAERNDPDATIVAASFQTVQNDARRAALGRRDVVLVDEVHHSAADTYAGVLDALREHNGARFFAGFTATLSRADGGLSDLWDTVAYERSLKWALDAGHLVAPVGKTVVVPGLDLTKVKVERGDYQTKALSTAMIASADTTVQAIQTHAAGRRMLVFGASVEHCDVLTDRLTAAGIAAATVVGSTPTDQRQASFAAFLNGDIDALVTVQVLTEGTDLPACDAVVIARPTRSPVLYTQIVGRALRPAAGKADALVLDLAGTTRDVALVTLSELVPSAPTSRVSVDSDDDPGQEESGSAPARRVREGAVDMVDFDVIGGTNVLWLSTARGVPFVEAKVDGTTTYGFIYDDGTGACRAGIVSNPGRDHDGFIGGDGVTGTYEQAREAVEYTLSKMNAAVTLKSAPWRSRPTPTDGQIAFGNRLGIVGADNMTKARLSDAISVTLASRLLDPHLRPTPEGN